MTALPLTLPSWRPARITAEVLVDKHGSPTYYVWADNRLKQDVLPLARGAR